MYDYLGGKSMTDAEQREAARQFVNRWMGKGKEDEDGRNINPLLWGEYKVYNVRICV